MKYQIIFEYKDEPKLTGVLIHKDQNKFSLKQSEEIVDQYNSDPNLSMFFHRLEAAE